MEITNHRFNTVGNRFFYHHTTTVQDDDFYFGPEAHGQYELLYLVSGSLTHLIEGKTYEVKPGDMILIAPNDIHALHVRGKVPYERMVLHFNLELLTRAFQTLEADPLRFDWSRRSPIIPAELCREYGLDRLMLSIIENKESDRYRSFFTVSRTMELILQLDKLFSNREHALTQPISIDPLIQRMVEFIDEHLTETFSLDDMASKLYISKSTLCHRFRDHMKMTVNRYITVKRIYYAAELIRKGMSAVEAGSAVGYSNYTTFFYNYKQIMGVNPSAKNQADDDYLNAANTSSLTLDAESASQ